MIEYIAGKIAEITPTSVVIDCAGLGYLINISLQDFSALEKETEAKLFIHEVIREDAHDLYGFLSRDGREMFRLLIGVSGVGPGTARLILSGMTLAMLAEGIASGNVNLLKNVKGIGAKTAQRIILDLKDKIKAPIESLSTQPGFNSEVYDETLAALTMLGFASMQSQKALKKVFESSDSLTTEQALKLALKMM